MFNVIHFYSVLFYSVSIILVQSFSLQGVGRSASSGLRQVQQKIILFA